MSDDLRLSNPQELLFRQVHPTFLHNGLPSSQIFMPTSKDGGRLSCDRSSVISARLSFHRYTRIESRASVGVVGATVGDFADESIACFDDPIPPSGDLKGNPAHCLADFSSHGTATRRVIAKRLTRIASERGWLQL